MTNYLKSDFDLNSDKLIDVFDELPLWSAPFGLKLLKGIKYKQGITAVDIGFGSGFPLTEIAMRLGKDSKIYGIDCWDAAVDRAEKKIELYGIKNIEIIRGVAENIPLDNHSTDLIVSNNGLNNVNDLEMSLSECARILKPGGQFIQTINLNDSMLEFYSAMEKVLISLGLNSCLDLMHEQINKKRKPLDEYVDLIKSHGFGLSSILLDKFEYHFVDGTSLLNHYFIRLAFLDGWKSIVPEDTQKEVFEKIEDELNTQSDIKGVLKLSVPFVLIDCERIL